MSKQSAVKLRPAAIPVEARPAKKPLKLKKSRKFRHIALALSFVAMVVVPIVASGYYLYNRAADQYHSQSAFSVRSEEVASPLDVLGAFTQTGPSSTPDSAILDDFIRSQTVVEKVSARLDLDAMFNVPDDDPIFTLGADQPIEAQLSYWQRMVRPAVDSASGVIAIEVRAFRPEDAQQIAQAIIDESATLVEELSRDARQDAMRYTLDDVAKAEDRLKEMRKQIREFRTEYQIIDPEADVASQVGIVSALQRELAASLIELETIQSYTERTDPRLPNIQRRIDAIRNQIANERAAVGSTSDGRSLSDIIGEYEELLVDLEFSQNAYTAALAAEEQARIEANRRSRYLAVHIPPTMAEQSIYPSREILLLVIAACAFAAWGVLVMIYYNIHDRR